MNTTILILAVVAAFLGYRLYSILGKRTGHEQEPWVSGNEPRTGQRTVPPFMGQQEQLEKIPANGNSTPADLVYEPRAEQGIRAILGADRSFSVGQFLDGAKYAYRLILEAYWKGDRAALRELCDDDTYEAFVGAIEAREARGEILDNRLVTIENAIVSDAGLSQGWARVTVRLDADIAAVTRDKDGKVIAGSLTDAIETHDVWTFSRHISSKDPNWKLDETDEA